MTKEYLIYLSYSYSLTVLHVEIPIASRGAEGSPSDYLAGGRAAGVRHGDPVLAGVLVVGVVGHGAAHEVHVNAVPAGWQHNNTSCAKVRRARRQARWKTA